MRNHHLYLLGIILFFFGCAESAENQVDEQIPQSYEIPFELTSNNNMLFTVALNRTDSMKMMFHTASSGITMVEAATKVFPSLKFEEDSLAVESWGAGGSARYSKNNRLQIGPFAQDSVTIYENQLSGEGSAGKFGPDFFGDFILELDFDKKVLIVHMDMPAYASEFKETALKTVDDFMFLVGELQIDSSYIMRNYLIHTGYSGGLLLDDEFVAEQDLASQLEVLKENELKDAYGNIIKTKEAITPKFRISSFALDDVPTSFFEGSIGRQKMSIVGGDVVKRFNMIIDRRGNKLYLKRNSL